MVEKLREIAWSGFPADLSCLVQLGSESKRRPEHVSRLNRPAPVWMATRAASMLEGGRSKGSGSLIQVRVLVFDLTLLLALEFQLDTCAIQFIMPVELELADPTSKGERRVVDGHVL